MTDLSTIDPHLDIAAGTCRVVIETPRGSRIKYGYQPDIGAFALSGQLPAGMSFPLDFGFVPGTLAEDGDPLDILVIGDEPAAVGTVAHVRLLGVIEAEETERNGKTVRNDRLIARVAASIDYGGADHVEDLGATFVDHLGRFFVNYNALKAKSFRVLGIAGPERAAARIEDRSVRLDLG